MKILFALAFAASLSGCATMPGGSAGSVATSIAPAVARADAAYVRARPYAEMLLPYLAPERAARVRLAMAIVERALLAARLATTAAAQTAALHEAQQALAVVEVTAVR